jgi:tRNA 5-methylaminomethyl-2-thiouridine biosynthesis bifunctional protein
LIPSSPRHALVIGAGLAGAAVSAALVGRGWQVTLLDAADGPARAASSLPVGMLSPHVTRAPTPLSRLSVLGVADMRAELERLLPQGQGWQACEVDNLGHDPGRWPAALVRPAALVQAWLAEAGASTRLTTRWNSPVARLSRTPGGEWQALDDHSQVVAQAPTVVVASAFGSLDLLVQTHPGLEPHTLPLRPVKGQMSLGEQRGPALAPRPQRNNGVFVPLYEDSGLPPEWPARVWSMGSTYRRGDSSTSLNDADHQQNLHSLQALHAGGALQMEAAAGRGELLGWAQVRCASLDRLPLVGAVPDTAALAEHMAQAAKQRTRPPLADCPRVDGLYMLGALGSRGLTLAHWCARLLARQMAGEAAHEVPPDLVNALDPARFAWRQARKQGRPAGA